MEITPEPVVVVPYDPAWPKVFASIKSQLFNALEGHAVAIEHVGSTSVPGLAAKPIIDIDIIIASEVELPLVVAKLTSFGYVYEGEKGILGRHAFRPPGGLSEHHLYVCGADNPELHRHLAFRDYLRSDPAEAEAYAKLKQSLAVRFGSDREGYSEAKTTFVEAALRKAEAKRRSTQFNVG